MRVIHKIFCFLLFSLAAIACVKEKETSSVLEKGQGWLLLDFGADADFEIRTRSTLDETVERKVFNLYVFVFDGDGDKIFAKWLGAAELKEDYDVLYATVDCWSVDNEANPVRGRIKIHTTTGTGYKIYALSNIDADMINVSSDKLGALIQTESDLLDFKADLNQNTIARNGYFPMSGKVSDVTITPNNITSPNFPLWLHRMDAKIKFVFRADKASTDAAGQRIERFIPVSWRVVNVPRSIYVMSYEDRGIPDASGYDAGNSAEQFFTSAYTNFEEFASSDESSFSFYMMENRRTPKVAPTEYEQRSKQTKNPDGTNLKNADGSLNFAYADDWSTYVEVKGKIEMNLVNDNAGQILHSDVKYIIHLGDFEASPADFNVKRNHFYRCTVNVVSPHNIRVEIETDDQENQPGAVGAVTIAKEEIAICDAHYVNKTMTFHAKDITDDLTWYVKTPFCDGGPQIVNGEDVPTGLDYVWVRFRLNAKDGSGQYFEERRRPYTNTAFVMNSDGTHNDGVMDISQFVKFIKEEKRKFDIAPASSVFDNTDNTNGGPKISVTAFVDEYYYDKNPITGEVRPDLWKLFVNQPERYMYILSDSKLSKDKESRMTGSVVTIEQKSITSIYNVDLAETSLQSAWGIERTDEHPYIWQYNYATRTENRGNTDLANGRLNTAREWGLADAWSTTFNSSLLWGRFMDLEVPNDIPELLSSYRYLRYSCLTRNRDNNGNGRIDHDEMRWYMASIRQLVGMWIGVDAIDQNSKMYNRTPEQRKSSDENLWRQHVISSTSTSDNSNNPQKVWAEEGASTGDYNSHHNLLYATTRCVRDLGLPADNPLDVMPQPYVNVVDNPDGTKTVKNTYLNSSCIRYFTSRDLDEGSELSEENKVYWQFQIAAANSAVNPAVTYDGLNRSITASSTQNPYCPAGYRLPNQRELSLMKLYVNGLTLPGMPTRTYWSMGSIGQNPYKENKSYFGHNGNLFLANTNNSLTNSIRCIRDVRVN